MSVTNRFPEWGKTGEIPQIGFQYDGGDQVNEKHLNFLWDAIQKQTDDFIAETDGLQAQIDNIDTDGDGIVDEADYANDGNASTYKGNDIDTDGDGAVNEAESGSAGFQFLGDVIAADGEILWDESLSHIPQGRLENDSVTVAGNIVALGGSTEIALGDLSNVSASGEGAGGGFDADTVDGNHASDLASDNHDNSSHSVEFTTLAEVNANADVPNADYADSAGNANSLGGTTEDEFSRRTSPARSINGGYVRHPSGNGPDSRSKSIGHFEDDFGDESGIHNGITTFNVSGYIYAWFNFTITCETSGETGATVNLTIMSSDDSTTRNFDVNEGETTTSGWMGLYVAPDSSVSYEWTLDPDGSNQWSDVTIDSVDFDRQMNWDEYVV